MPDEDIYGPISREDDEGDKIYEDLCSIKKNRASVVSAVLLGHLHMTTATYSLVW